MTKPDLTQELLTNREREERVEKTRPLLKLCKYSNIWGLNKQTTEGA